MHKGPTGPSSGRTPRSQAEKIGTTSSGFTGSENYCVEGGHPITPNLPHQVYREQQGTGGNAGPAQPPSPFKTTGGK